MLPASPQDTAQGREGMESTGKFYTKEDKILLGRETRHPTKNGQSEGMLGLKEPKWGCAQSPEDLE